MCFYPGPKSCQHEMPLVSDVAEKEVAPRRSDSVTRHYLAAEHLREPDYSFFLGKATKTTEEIKRIVIGKTTERKGRVRKHFSK